MKDISLPKLLLNTRFQLFASQKGSQFSVHMADDAFCISIAECSFFVGERRDLAVSVILQPNKLACRRPWWCSGKDSACQCR